MMTHPAALPPAKLGACPQVTIPLEKLNINDPSTNQSDSQPNTSTLSLPMIQTQLEFLISIPPKKSKTTNPTPIDTDLSRPTINTSTFPTEATPTISPIDGSNYNYNNIPIGNSILSKNPDSTRLNFQNIHGCKRGKTWHDWISAAKYLHDTQVDVIGYAETNINWTPSIIKEAKQGMLRHYNKCVLSVSGSTDHTTYTGQAGGTVTMITNNITGRITQNLSDTTGLGRWSGIRLRCYNSKHLSIITAYCPNVDTKYGTDTCYQQQYRILQTKSKSPPKPRDTFFADISQFINQLQYDNDDVILQCDANTDIGSQEMLDLINSTNLVSLAPNYPIGFSTFMRGKRVIDHMFGTSYISQNVCQIGITAFHDNAWITDHRALFMDLHTNAIFGGKLDHIEAMPRNLKSNNHPRIQTFLHNINEQHTIDEILHQLQQIQTSITWGETERSHFNRLDAIFTSTLVTAEAQLKPQKPTPWSPTLHTAHLIYTYWRKHNSAKVNNINITHQLQDIYDKVGDLVYFNNKHRHHRMQLRKATANYWSCQRNAQANRDIHLATSLQKYDAPHQRQQRQIIKNIIKAEQKRAMYQQIRALNKPSLTTGGLSHILIANPNNQTVRRIDDIEEMNDALYQRNKSHFAQAHGSPCTTPNVMTVLGSSGTTPAAINITKGLIPSHLSPNMQLLMREINSNPTPIPHHYAMDDMIKGFKTWKERTTTSPSGKHLGIYKSMIVAQQHNIFPTKPNLTHHLKESTLIQPSTINPGNSSTNSPQSKPPHTLLSSNHTPPLPNEPILSLPTKLLTIQNLLMNIAIQQSHPIPRWQTVHNFFIEKVPGTPLIEKLRVIHIFEADYNLLLKFFIAKQTLHHAIDKKITTDEQAGGRPGRQAIDEALRTIVNYEICRIQRLSGSIMYNDAKACFDRVVENLSNLSCYNAGAPVQILNLHHNTVNQMRYYIKHQRGIYSKANGHYHPDPFYGVGQGAGDSGTRWGFISDAIIKVYNKYAHDAIISSPITNIATNTKVQAFVDDSRLFAIVPTTSRAVIGTTLQQDVQLWQDMMHEASAKLELLKCKFIIFTWAQDLHGGPILTNHSQQTPIPIYDSSNDTNIGVESIQPYDAYKLLGVEIAFDGNHIKQLEALATKVQHIISVFTKLRLLPHEIILGYHTVALPTLHYALAATTIPPKSLDKLQQKLAYGIIPKMGINRRFPRAVVYAPKYFGGLGFPNLSTEQPIAHVKSIIGHFRLQTTLSVVYAQALESFMILSGIPTPPFEDLRLTDYIRDTPWIDTTRNFLRLIQGRITINTIPTILPLRANDICIMDNLHGYSTIDQQHINQCRQHLQVIYLSELANSEGTHLRTEAILHQTQSPPLSVEYRRSIFNWPTPNTPPSTSWYVWRKHIATYLKPTTTTTLKHSLGQWTQPYSTSHWKYMRHKTIDIIIEYCLSTYHVIRVWHPTFTTRKYVEYTPAPRDLVTLFAREEMCPCFPTEIDDTRLQSTFHQNSISDIDISPKAQVDHHHHRHFTPYYDRHIDHLYNVKPLRIYTYGEVQFSTPYISWQSHVHNMIMLYGAYHLSPTSADTKLRSSILSIVAALQQYHGTFLHANAPIPNQELLVYTMDKRILRRLQQFRSTKPTSSFQLSPDHEALSLLVDLMLILPNVTIILLEDVCTTPQQKHDRFIIRKCQQQIHRIQACETLPATIGATDMKASLFINNREIPTDILQEMRFAAQSPELRRHFQQKYQWTNNIIDTIDWEVHASAIRQSNPYRFKTIIQAIHGWLPTHAHHASSYNITSKCPMCNQEEETNQHFLSCSAPSVTTKVESLLQALYDRLVKIKLDPILLYYILQSVTHWRTIAAPPTPDFCTGSYKKLFSEQSAIGWSHLIQGRISTCWVDIQNEYETNALLKAPEGSKTLARAIAFTFEVVSELWQFRCNEKHHQSHDIAYRHNILIPKIRYLYSQGPDLLTNDRNYFDLPIDNIMTKSTKYIKQWIPKTESYIAAALSRVKNHMSFTPAITKYFIPTKANPKSSHKARAKVRHMPKN
jgi:hypothetical protein